MNSSFKKTVLATVLAGTLGGVAMQAAEANVLNVTFKGAFTMLNPSGSLVTNSPSDYKNGFYGLTGSASGPATTWGWKGARTPITGTMSFDTSTAAGVATVNPFLFFGNLNANYANALGITMQGIDSVGTLVGGMVFSWNGGSHQISIVMDAGQLFAQMGTLIGGGATTTVGGSYTLLSPGPAAPAVARTSMLNTGAGCNGVTLATQVNAYTINTNMANLGICTTGMVNDGIPGVGMTSPSFGNFNGNFDIMSATMVSYVTAPAAAVPVPAAVWLFGSGLLGLVGIARRKKKA